MHRKGQKWPEKVKKIAAGKGKNGQRLKSAPCKKSGKGRNGENSKKKWGGGKVKMGKENSEGQKEIKGVKRGKMAKKKGVKRGQKVAKRWKWPKKGQEWANKWGKKG